MVSLLSVANLRITPDLLFLKKLQKEVYTTHAGSGSGFGGGWGGILKELILENKRAK